ncbi:MATE family efflux transporter [Butyrivibrio sp. AE2032]|uniref:MATE family efflux transporter n=1 Tax=Butyrivibrio sp. AE2032 TaxID=1458463 RepID=UPI0005596603|nr:MATE family efflux transporter [Butyrivibrio sp. AE2032]
MTHKKGFCEQKFSSMLISGTFTKAVMYLMLLSDSIIAGYFIGASGVAGINAITPVTAIVTFFGDLVSTGVGIVFARETGAMRKDRADKIYGQGLIISIGMGLLSALLIFVSRDMYFAVSGITGDILNNALEYYRLVPINAFLTIVIFYLEQMVYSDGDELCNNICYGFQIGGNVILSIILTKFFGMTGIILGSVIGNALGILVCCWHFFRKCNTLHFVWHLSIKDFLLTSRYSIVDSSVYICWGLMDYVMISHVSGHYGENGLITLAVVVSLIEFGVVMDGVGMAMQPLIGTYFGEGNPKLIKRVMKSGIKASIIEGAAATLLILIFAKQFCALFGITDGEALAPSIAAIRIVCLGFVFCSLVSLTTSYYMLIDRIGMATAIACFQNGLLYIILPITGSLLFGFYGMWAGFVVAPAVALTTAMLFVFFRFKKDNFPFLLKSLESDIEVLDGTLTPDAAVALSKEVSDSLLARQYPAGEANRAALFVEETGLTILDMNSNSKKPVLMELSLFFEEDSVLIIERDSGKLFDLTDPDVQVKGLSGFILSGLMASHQEKAYLVTTGYNRNMLRFSKGEKLRETSE